MDRKIAHLIIKYRLIFLLLIAGMTLFCLFELRNVGLYYGSGIMPEGHPYVKLQEHMVYEFGGANMVAIALRVKEGDIFNISTLAKVKRIQEKLLLMDGVVRYKVLSIASRKLNRIYSDVDEFGYSGINMEFFDDMVKKILAGDRDCLATYISAILNDGDIYGVFVSKDLKGTLIMANFKRIEDYAYIFDQVQKIIQEEIDSNTEFYVAGFPIMLGYILSYMKFIIFLFGGSILAMISLLYLDFRSLRGCLLPLAGAFMTVIWSMGILTFLGYKIDVMSLTVPFLILSLAHGHAVQILTRYYEEARKYTDSKKVCEESLAGLIRPASASIITDSAGFASLYFLPFPIMKSMAIVGTFGLLSILIVTFCFIALILSFLPLPRKARVERDAEDGWLIRFMLNIGRLSLSSKGKGVVLISYLIIILIALLGLRQIRVGELMPGSPDFWQDSEYNIAERVLNEGFAGTNNYWIYVAGKEDNDLFNPQIIRDVDALETLLRDRGDVGYTSTFTGRLKKLNMALNENDPKWEVLPTTTEMTSQFFSMLTSLGGPEDTRDLFAKDFRQANIQVFMKDHMADTITSIEKQTADFVKKEKKSQVDIKQAAGLIGIYAAVIEELKKVQIPNILEMLVIVLIFVTIVFRSIIAGLIILIPLISSNLITFSAMGFGKVGLFVYTLPVAAIGIGVGVDFSLYILSRIREEMAKGGDVDKNFLTAMTTGGRAVFFTGLTVIIALVLLIFSKLRFQAILGVMLTVVLAANMFLAILLLPTLLLIFKPRFLFRSL